MSVFFWSCDRFTTFYKIRPPDLPLLWWQVESSREPQPFSPQAKISLEGQTSSDKKLHRFLMESFWCCSMIKNDHSLHSANIQAWRMVSDSLFWTFRMKSTDYNAVKVFICDRHIKEPFNLWNKTRLVCDNGRDLSSNNLLKCKLSDSLGSQTGCLVSVNACWGREGKLFSLLFNS